MTVAVTEDTLYRDVAGEGVLLNLNTGLYYGLDEVANRMWQLIAELGSLEQVEERLQQEYEAAPAILSRDLRKLVDELLAHNLLREAK